MPEHAKDVSESTITAKRVPENTIITESVSETSLQQKSTSVSEHIVIVKLATISKTVMSHRDSQV